MTSDSRSTVLVVDDEPELVALVARMLEPDGYQILTATLGAEALRVGASSDRPIDLLLTDLHMPGMTGRSLSVELRKHHLGLKVLYLTGHSDDLFGTLTLLEPHEAFMEKPITAVGIREAVSIHLYGLRSPPMAQADRGTPAAGPPRSPSE